MNKQTRSYATIALMALLAVALIAQSYYLIRLNGKITELEASGASSNPQPDFLAPAVTTAPPTLNQYGYADPFAAMRQMQERMDSLFGSSFGSFSPLSSSMFNVQTAPQIELTENEEDYQIVVDVPENGELELSTDVEDNTVRLSGSVNYSNPTQSTGLVSSFTSRSQFSRSIPLSKPVDPLAMQTNNHDGAIVITIPKA